MVPPVFFDLHPQLQMDFGIQQLLDLKTGCGTDLLEHGPAFADDNAFVALSLTIDHRVDGHQTILPLLPFFDFHRHAVRYFLVQLLKHFFPDDLGYQLAFRLIGDHLLGKQGRRGHTQLFQLPEQFLLAFPGAGAEGDDGGKVVGLPIKRHHFQQFFFFHGVDLVDHQDAGHLLPFDPVDEHLLRDPDAGHRLHQQNSGIHIGHRFVDHLHHKVAQSIFGFMQAGGIQKHHLIRILAEHAGDPITGGLGLVAHNGHLGPAQGVGQGGFAHIGPAYHRKDAGFFDHIFSPVSRRSPSSCMISSSRFRIRRRSSSSRSWSYPSRWSME